jgi:hypothetical protein
MSKTKSLTGKADIDSFRMNKDEVLQFIPELEWETYQVCIQGKDIRSYKMYNDEPKKYTTTEALQLACSGKKDKIFLVDTINKKIEICYWLFEDNFSYDYLSSEENTRLRLLGVDQDEIPTPTTNRNFRQRIADDQSNVFLSNRNSRYSSYSLSIINSSLIEVRVEFTRTLHRYHSQPSLFGGTKGKMTYVGVRGWDVHHISIQRNLYLGFQPELSNWAPEEETRKRHYRIND